jgi:alanine-glyoxylate transaminase/serine-glyoxylate transaminase/serine-pyruvate transaminase
MSAPTLGHLDPRYRAILDETCEMLRQVFQTKNPLTLPVSGIGDVAVLSACKRMQRMPFAASPRASGGR